MNKLEQGLHKKRCVKKYDKVLERIGRIKQRFSKAAQQYEIEVKNHTTLTEPQLWQTYTMLTDLESVFRLLKSELELDMHPGKIIKTTLRNEQK